LAASLLIASACSGAQRWRWQCKCFIDARCALRYNQYALRY
jgi:hypothetical protein